jgi:hypothetical protein
MISLDNVNKIIKELGGDEIDAQLFNFIHDEVLGTLRWACYREDFPEDANRFIEYFIAIKGILNTIEADDLKISKEPIEKRERLAKSISIENTRIEFDSRSDEEIRDAKILSYKNRLIDLFDSRLEIFCSRYRCLKW